MPPPSTETHSNRESTVMEQQEKNGRMYRNWDSGFIDYRESGMTVKAFCEEHGSVQGLWCRLLSERPPGNQVSPGLNLPKFDQW